MDMLWVDLNVKLCQIQLGQVRIGLVSYSFARYNKNSLLYIEFGYDVR